MVDLTPTPTSALAVGDPARRPAGRAVLGSLTLAALFVLAILPAPALPTMWSNGPWAQDPYHVVVSFAVFFVPLVFGVCVLAGAAGRPGRAQTTHGRNEKN